MHLTRIVLQSHLGTQAHILLLGVTCDAYIIGAYEGRGIATQRASAEHSTENLTCLESNYSAFFFLQFLLNLRFSRFSSRFAKRAKDSADTASLQKLLLESLMVAKIYASENIPLRRTIRGNTDFVLYVGISSSGDRRGFNYYTYALPSLFRRKSRLS
jgi:hypothetical protein